MAYPFVKGELKLHPGYAAFFFRSSTGFGHSSGMSPMQDFISQQAARRRALGLCFCLTLVLAPARVPGQCLVQTLVPGTNPYGEFGQCIAVRDSLMIVGASGYEAAHVFRREGDGWREEAKLVGDSLRAYYGFSVALGENLAVVGAPQDDERATNAGAVYIYRRLEDSWALEGKVTAPDASAGDYFGYAVSVSGDRLAICAIRADIDGVVVGAVYVFEFTDGAWSMVEKLLGERNAVFACDVVLNDDLLFVGESHAAALEGRVRVYRRTDSGYVLETLIAPSSRHRVTDFGHSLAFDGVRLVVGAPNMHHGDGGEVFIFEYDGAAWVQTGAVKPLDSQTWSLFGIRVALRGDRIAACSVADDSVRDDYSSALVFEWRNGEWIQIEEIHPGAGHSYSMNEFAEPFDSVALTEQDLLWGQPRVDRSGRYGVVAVHRIGAVEKLKARCRMRQDPTMIRVVARTSLREGSALQFELDGDVTCDATVNARGRARCEWEIAGGGDRRVTIVTCPGRAVRLVCGAKSGCQTQVQPAFDRNKGFGYAVDVSGDLAVVAVESWLDDDRRGPGVVYRHTDGEWRMEGLLEYDPSAPDGAAAWTDGFQVAVGIPSAHSSAGAVILHAQDANGAWAQVQRLRPAFRRNDDRFGASVDGDDEWMIVGAPGEDELGDGTGAIYVFHRSGETWVEHQKLVVPQLPARAGLGSNVTYSEGRFAAGCAEKVCVFGQISGVWALTAELSTLDFDGAVDTAFGQSVALRGDRLAVGAPGDDDQNENAGAVYVFEFTHDAWAPDEKIFANREAEGRSVGHIVSFVDEVLLVGSVLEHGRGAFVFSEEKDAWRQLAILHDNESDVIGTYAIAGNGRFVVVASQPHGIRHGARFSAYDLWCPF
ncbi:MAG: hypothetical protein EDS66_16850 [Planctomycetota bacterium]|nr:MAG: hypothetical protein EDS66_16850 [Planctomycetota bacterium]KAB2941912.1 MAG: hypothetical protein F9K17_12680 [Phycisphaerae bacterium]MCQ3922280.1 hypothetical protein [Planctomycetota bacterium]